jgi:hypothetical protein
MAFVRKMIGRKEKGERGEGWEKGEVILGLWRS